MDKKIIKIRIRKAMEKNLLKDDIQKISLFGSYLDGNPKKNSDVDLLIEFLPSAKIGFFKLIDIQENLEQTLGKKIDLLTPESISEYFRPEVINKAEIIYEK